MGFRDLLAGHTAGLALTDGERRTGFADLPDLIGAEADWLRDRGARRIGLLADNGWAWAVTDLALTDLALDGPARNETGPLQVPIPGYFTGAQTAHLLGDAGLDALLTDQPSRVAALDAGFSLTGRSPITGLILWQRPLPAGAPPLPPGTAKVTYTSGSTGRPRGVCLSAGLQLRVAEALAAATAGLRLRRHLCLLPLPTLLENIAGIYAPLLAGAACVVPPLAATGMGYGGLQPGRLTAAIDEHQPESLILVPELLRVLVQAVILGWQPPASLRFIAVGGAVVAPALLEQAARLGLPVFEGYGLSECGSVVCLNTPGSDRRGSVGRPLPHVTVRLDARRQLLVREAGMLGYLDDVPGSAPAEIATGDLGGIDADGFVYVRGRLKNLLITSLGRNIAPEWVERELQLEPEIGTALVVGEARPWLAALVSPPPGVPAQPAAIDAAISRANGRLPDYARVRTWAMAAEPFSVANGSLTANGRLRRGHILRQHRATIEALYSLASLPAELPA